MRRIASLLNMGNRSFLSTAYTLKTNLILMFGATVPQIGLVQWHFVAVGEYPLPSSQNHTPERAHLLLPSVAASPQCQTITRKIKERPDADRAVYADAEQEARIAKRWLWRDHEPTPPGVWRKLSSHYRLKMD